MSPLPLGNVDALDLAVKGLQVDHLDDRIQGTVDEKLLIGAHIHVGHCPVNILRVDALLHLPLIRV
jgi:hypothetical protein